MHCFYAREASHLRVVLTPEERLAHPSSNPLREEYPCPPRLWNRTPLEIDAEEKS
jgi:hypothetical protein